MQSTLFADLTTGILSDSPGGSAVTLEPWIQGDQPTIKIRLTQTLEDTTSEAKRVVRGWQAGLGVVDARPTGGQFTLCIGSGPWTTGVNKTTELPYNAAASDVQLALNALTGPTVLQDFTVALVKGSYLIAAAGGVAFDLTLGPDTLEPVTLAIIRPYSRDSKEIRELRLTQAPVAFTDQQSRVLPAVPTITRAEAGQTVDGVKYPELQDLFAPSEFDATFIVTWQGRDSFVIDPAADTEVEVLAALAPLADAGGTFKVTPLPRRGMRIAFHDSMSGIAQDLMEVVVLAPPEGDITFTLPLDRYELAAALRDAPATGVVFPFEVRALFEDTADSDIIRRVTIHRGEVTVLPELLGSDLGTPPNINFLKPWQPVSYQTEDPRNLAVTTQHAPFYLGDDAAHEFTLTHGLDTLDILVPELYEVATGRMMVMAKTTGQLDAGTADYICHILNTDQIKITLAAANIPAAAALRLVISTAGPVTAFINALVINQSQVTGLEARLAGYATRLGVVETAVGIIGGGSTVGSAATESIFTVDLDDIAKVYPWRGEQPVFTDFKGLRDEIAKKKMRPLGLLNAVSTGTITALTIPVPAPDVAHIGHIYQNQSGSTVEVSFPGLGHRSFKLADDEFAMSDGRLWFKARRFGSENTYYPQDFEQKLFVIPIDGDDLTVDRIMSVDFAVQVGTVLANTTMQWVLEFRWAALTADAFTTGAGPNLNDVAWDATPLLKKRIIITDTPATHTYGLRVQRTGSSTWAGTAIVGGSSKAANGINTANFVIGAFLCRADIDDDDATDPRGFLGLIFPKPSNAGDSDTLGQLTIK